MNLVYKSLKIGILVLLIFINFGNLQSQRLLDCDLIEISKKLIFIEVLSSNYNELNKRYTNDLDTVKNIFELQAPDSILRKCYLDEYKSISFDYFKHCVFNTYSRKIKINNDSINILNIWLEDTLKINDKKNYIIALDYRGNYYPIYGFRKINMESLYKSYFSKPENNSLFARIYLEYKLAIPDSMIANNTEFQNVLKYYPEQEKLKNKLTKNLNHFSQNSFITVEYKHYPIIKEDFWDYCVYITNLYFFEFTKNKFKVKKKKLNSSKPFRCY